MSMNLCCLCCNSCSSGCKHLQNEVYEITVKYFDPMLLAEHLNANSAKESCVLCQNCWSHIETFHDFHETVISGRNSLDQLILQPSSLDFKEEQVLSNFAKNSTSDKCHNDDFNLFNNVLVENSENKAQSEKDLQTPNDRMLGADRYKKKLRNSHTISVSPCSETDTETNNGDRLYLEKTHKTKAKKRLHKSLLKKKFSNGSCDGEISNNKVANSSGYHPALDKGREYDQFIAEWKSQLECDICNEVFPIFDLLKVHFKENHNAKGFVKCCDRKFDRRCSLVDHIRLHINPEMHKCDVCGKVIGSKYSLIHHKKTIHEESKKFKCNKCPKIFKQKQNLKCHLLTHVTGNRDYKCEECDKAYVHEVQLKKHIKLVHVDNRVCDQCGKTLHGIGALKNHLKEHENVVKAKFPCDECGAELGSRITLKRHKASYHHDGTTVYVCGICGKVSSTERALKNHKNFVHEKERKFKCPNCDKAFKRIQNLQEHIATHTGEALYQCPQCPRSFKISSKYHEHRKKVHPIEWEEGRKNRLEKQKINFERVKNQVVL